MRKPVGNPCCTGLHGDPYRKPVQVGFSFRGPVRKPVQKPCMESHWMLEVQTAPRAWQRTAATLPYTSNERRTGLPGDATRRCGVRN